jgi:hypothetical protein
MSDKPGITMARAVIDEGAFRELVAGRSVRLPTGTRGQFVELILSDIGFSRMADAIADAKADALAAQWGKADQQREQTSWHFPKSKFPPWRPKT